MIIELWAGPYDGVKVHVRSTTSEVALESPGCVWPIFVEDPEDDVPDDAVVYSQSDTKPFRFIWNP